MEKAIRNFYLPVQVEGVLECAVRRLKELLIEQGTWLAEGFRRDRIKAQTSWIHEQEAQGVSRGSLSRQIWCPLNLFSREQNGSLQIYWQLVYRSRATKKIGYQYLRRSEGGDYDLRTLFKHARDFEKDLVKEHEEEARRMRRRWSEVIGMGHRLSQFVALEAQENALRRRWNKEDLEALRRHFAESDSEDQITEFGG